MSLIGKLGRALREEGVQSSLEKTVRYVQQWQDERRSVRQLQYTKADLEKQKKAVFKSEVCISILVPVCHTALPFLRETIASVQSQTYDQWELCLVDSRNEPSDELECYCRRLADKDNRIHYRKQNEKSDFAETMNAVIQLSAGKYFALLQLGDLLHPAALYEIMQKITMQHADFIYTDDASFHRTPDDAFSPRYKPDFAPDTLRSCNYIGRLTVFSRSLMDEAGGFQGAYGDYDMILRLSERAKKIAHVPRVLYYCRDVESSIAVQDRCVAERRALKEHLNRIGMSAEVSKSAMPFTYRVQYQLSGQPLISILIPSCDHASTLKRCIDSILEKSTYRKFEIIVIENNSIQPETFYYYETLEAEKKAKVIRWEGKFNYSAINNFGAQHGAGEYFLLLNNDIEVITPSWLEEMLMFAQRSDVGAVGALLYYPSDKVQHGGIVLGIGGVAENAFKHIPRGNDGYMSRLSIAQNVSAVTAACLMVSRKAYEQAGGLDESFEVAFNDVDFCMRLRKMGFLNVFTPYAQLYHYESESRGAENTPEKRKRFQGEIARFQERWRSELEQGDPYYNPNLSLRSADFQPRNKR